MAETSSRRVEFLKRLFHFQTKWNNGRIYRMAMIPTTANVFRGSVQCRRHGPESIIPLTFKNGIVKME
jgi:hypothetical protein